MKMFLSVFSLLSLTGLLFMAGCASENGQGGSYDTMESSQGQVDSYDIANNNGDYWGHALH